MGEGLQRAFKAARETQMVPENDPEFSRFWAAYPMRVAKKDARKAWLDLQPSPALVDRMIETLRWQGAIWAVHGYGTPYPASWLRAERWTDEPPVNGNGRGHAPVFAEWTCPHVEEHASQWRCEQATALHRPRKAEA